MRKVKIVLGLFLLVLFSVLALWPVAAQTPPPKGAEPTPTSIAIGPALRRKIEPPLLKALLTAEAEPVPFIVYLRARADLETALAAVPLTAQGEPDELAQRRAIVESLQQTAGQSQAGLLQALSQPPGVGLAAASDIRPLWIINAVAARGSLETVLALAARPEVKMIRLDDTTQLNYTVSATESPQWNISHIRADLAHNALGFDGAGVVVANVDTGVDWQHPALQSRYRGYTGPGKLPQHTGNWHDAIGEETVYPVDIDGHGTHTMGTIVGGEGFGVAPGARWIAARAFDRNGIALDSWIHAAFQWLLAPDGDPALAPDIINNSWSNINGGNQEFEDDITTLELAGIFVVFSAGNEGPAMGTVGSPGSLNNAFAVGATSIDDEVAYFSGRGPSPWGKIKPEVAAPGKDIVSTWPGGGQYTLDGTSMAAPHVAGLAALVKQAAPNINLNQLAQVITTTAVPLGDSIPNNHSGWGRIDAYNAVMSVASVGVLHGSITEAGPNTPIPQATLQITAHTGGPIITTIADQQGQYHQGLAAGTYDVTVSAFGYMPVSAFGVVVVTNATTTRNFQLSPQPAGGLVGYVREQGTNAPLSATIIIEDTPLRESTNPTDGRYSLSLPVGAYTVTVIASEHRIEQRVVTIYENNVTVQDFLLVPAPAILLVDSGAWYQDSEIDYYQQALRDLRYTAALWQVHDLETDIPTAETLQPYDIVIWSAPLDSPGYIEAETALEGFLEAGGKLLLSGQDVAYFDGGGDIIEERLYFRRYLKAAYVNEEAGLETVVGTGVEPFGSLTLTLNGGDGADNQVAPDIVEVVEADFAGPILAYDTGLVAGIQAALCLPYRVIFLPFGFEAINSRADRKTVMERSINWLLQEPANRGVELTPPEEQRVGDFGAFVYHPVRVRNTGAQNDTYDLSFTSNWPVNPGPPGALSVTSCQSQVITVGVQVNTTQRHVSDTLTLSVRSRHDATVNTTARRITKSPAPILLVDDERWYSHLARYEQALAAAHAPYDEFVVSRSWVGDVPPSPSSEILALYPIVIWYTAYDWYQPLTTPEEERLALYLDKGGRLFFSSQDYIYNLPDGEPSAFATDYLGVLAHTEDFSSTYMVGEADNPVGNQLGSYPLIFPLGYNNWTDALTPTTAASIATRGQADQPNSLTNSGTGPTGQNWRTHFLGFGAELLPPDGRTRLMQRSLGWLSWLGRSTLTASRAEAVSGQDITYTAYILNDGLEDLSTVHFTATLPAELTLGSYSPQLSLSGNRLIWSGSLGRNQSKTFTYRTTLADPLPLGTVITQAAWLAYPEHALQFDRIAVTKVNFPDLSRSMMQVEPAAHVEAGDTLTYTIVLQNNGLVDAPLVTTTNILPASLGQLSLIPPVYGQVMTGSRAFTWITPLSRNQPLTLTYRAVISYRSGWQIDDTARVDDDLNAPFEIAASTAFENWPGYLPLIFKQ